MIQFTLLHPAMTQEHLGYIPQFLDIQDPRSAKEQINENYVSGWNNFTGFKMVEGNGLSYPGDPTYRPLAVATLREEKIYFYDHAWVAIVQPDGSFETARLD